ncbi:MAG: aminoglycoside phosphotransferase family protein [Acidobacteria bacterium]|nr:aminoglycoside phosphotransferase family protein [Acidobacteriota bacterium]
MSDSSLTAAALTRRLRLSGALPQGAVTGLRAEPEVETITSTLTFLTATYSADAPAGLPRRLVVKTPRAEHGLGGDLVCHEVEFYRRLAPALGVPPSVRCLAAVEEGEDDAGVIVLEDLRATHDHPPGPLPPSRGQCELALDALAGLHARWWESPELGRTVGELHTPAGLTDMVRGIAGHLPAFFDAHGDALNTEVRHVYERVFNSRLLPWLRLAEPRALTVAHGDAHTGNVLFPRAGTGPAFLIDWQLWHLDLGARDLAFLMALHWYPSRRREFEPALLRYYHDGLLARGVGGYSFDELRDDYRRCVVRNLTLPLILWSRGTKPEGWWHRLECAVAAYRDLDCDELL